MQCELYIVQIQYILQSLWQRFVQTDSYTFLNVSLPGRSGVEKREQITGGAGRLCKLPNKKIIFVISNTCRGYLGVSEKNILLSLP